MEIKISDAFWGVLLVALISRFILHRLTKQREREKLFNEVAERFRQSFEPIPTALNELKKGIPLTGRITEVLDTDHDKRASAMKELYLHLGWFRKRGFRKAWDEYCYPHKSNKEFKDKRLFMFAGYLIEAERKKSMQAGIDLVLKKINRLLSFAKPR